MLVWAYTTGGFPGGAVEKNLPANAGDSRDAGLIWRRKWQPPPLFLTGNPMDGGDWRATVHGVSV